jgi:hypothetical protein
MSLLKIPGVVFTLSIIIGISPGYAQNNDPCQEIIPVPITVKKQIGEFELK